MQDLVRSVDIMINLLRQISDAKTGKCVNGKLRTHHQSAYDWQRDGSRVECKSSRLSWQKTRQRWQFQFDRVKFGQFDDLLLALYTPSGVHIYRHNHSFGVASAGLSTSTSGHQILVGAPKGEMEWQEALQCIFQKLLNSGCKYIASVMW